MGARCTRARERSARLRQSQVMMARARRPVHPHARQHIPSDLQTSMHIHHHARDALLANQPLSHTSPPRRRRAKKLQLSDERRGLRVRFLAGGAAAGARGQPQAAHVGGRAVPHGEAAGREGPHVLGERRGRVHAGRGEGDVGGRPGRGARERRALRARLARRDACGQGPVDRRPQRARVVRRAIRRTHGAISAAPCSRLPPALRAGGSPPRTSASRAS